MARKTFISYKYSEAVNYRDSVIKALGKEYGQFYEGEHSNSPKLDDLKTNTIREKLKEMIYPTSVTIVLITDNVDKSEWMEWEIEYCLSNISRGDRTSRPNGIVMVHCSNDGHNNQKIQKLIRSKSNCVEVNWQEFIGNTTHYIEEAYKKVNG